MSEQTNLSDDKPEDFKTKKDTSMRLTKSEEFNYLSSKIDHRNMLTFREVSRQSGY